MKKYFLIITCFLLLLTTSCKKKNNNPKVIEAIVEEYHLILKYDDDSTKDFGYITKENYMDAYNLYISVNTNYTKDAYSWFLEFSEPFIVSVKIDNGKLIFSYSNNKESYSDEINHDNYLVLYEQYLKYNKEYKDDVETWYDEFCLKNEDDNRFTYVLNGNTYSIKSYDG